MQGWQWSTGHGSLTDCKFFILFALQSFIVCILCLLLWLTSLFAVTHDAVWLHCAMASSMASKHTLGINLGGFLSILQKADCCQKFSKHLMSALLCDLPLLCFCPSSSAGQQPLRWSCQRGTGTAVYCVKEPSPSMACVLVFQADDACVFLALQHYSQKCLQFYVPCQTSPVSHAPSLFGALHVPVAPFCVRFPLHHHSARMHFKH